MTYSSIFSKENKCIYPLSIYLISYKHVTLQLKNYYMGYSDDIDTLFRESYHDMYCFAYSVTHDEDASRDIVADSFEDLFRRDHSLSTNAEKKNFLFHIVRNKCVDHFRKMNVHNRYADYIHSSTKTNDLSYTESWIEHERKLEAVRLALADLPQRTREIVTDHYLFNKKYSEIADKFGISQSAVKKHVMQALRYLRAKFVKD